MPTKTPVYITNAGTWKKLPKPRSVEETILKPYGVGTLYKYYDVPEAAFFGLLGAGSKGKAHNYFWAANQEQLRLPAHTLNRLQDRSPNRHTKQGHKS